MSTPWNSREIRYLEEHSHEGAKEIARALGRSVSSVRSQAGCYGLSLRRRWHCPKCGKWVHKPLSDKTGWCAACSKAERAERLEREVADYVEEVRKEKEQDRRIQAAYARRHRAKKRRQK